jgi:hypothetical protein
MRVGVEAGERKESTNVHSKLELKQTDVDRSASCANQAYVSVNRAQSDQMPACEQQRLYKKT